MGQRHSKGRRGERSRRSDSSSPRAQSRRTSAKDSPRLQPTPSALAQRIKSRDFDQMMQKGFAGGLDDGLVEIVGVAVQSQEDGPGDPEYVDVARGTGPDTRPVAVMGKTYRITLNLKTAKPVKGLRIYRVFDPDSPLPASDLKVGEVMPTHVKARMADPVMSSLIPLGDLVVRDEPYNFTFLQRQPALPESISYYRCTVFTDENDLVWDYFWQEVILLTAADNLRTLVMRNERDERIETLDVIRSPFAHMKDLEDTDDYVSTMAHVAVCPYRFLDALDGTMLGARFFWAPTPGAVRGYVLHLGALGVPPEAHDYLCSKLSTDYNLSVLNLHYRGSGVSSGEPGSAPSATQLLKDIRTVVRTVFWAARPKDVPLVLAGWWHAGGLMLSYASWKDREPVDGYLFYGATFGRKNNLVSDHGAKLMRDRVRLNGGKLLLAGLTRGKVDKPVLRMQQPGLALSADDVTSQNGFGAEVGSTYTLNFLSPFTPTGVGKALRGLDRPAAMFIAGEYGYTDPAKAVAVAKKLPEAVTYNGRTFANHVEVLEDMDHFRMATHSHRHLGDWIMHTYAGFTTTELMHGVEDAPSVSMDQLDQVIEVSLPGIRDAAKLPPFDFGPLAANKDVYTPPLRFLEGIGGAKLNLLVYTYDDLAKHDLATYGCVRHDSVVSDDLAAIGEELQRSLQAVNLGQPSPLAKTLSFEPQDRSLHASVLPDQIAPCTIIVVAATGARIIAERLCRLGRGAITVNVCYPRGTGRSSKFEGSDETPLNDISRFVRRLKQFANARSAGPVFLLSFSLLTNWVLRYASWPKRDPVDGYIFLSSSLGQMRNKDHVISLTNMPKLDASVAEVFRVLEAVSPDAPIITPQLWRSLVIDDYAAALQKVDRPLAVLIGQDDEVASVKDVMAIVKQAQVHVSRRFVCEVKAANHYGILDRLEELQPFLASVTTSAQVAPSAPDLPPTLSRGDFNIVALVGRGGFGEVRLARYRGREDAVYAIKIMQKRRLVAMDQVAGSVQESKLLRDIRHPLIVRWFGSFKDTDNLYMVMDFVIGGELFSLIKLNRRMPEEMARFYAAEIVLCLEYLHSRYICFRDLKPENILLDMRGHIRLVDFGFAKVLGSRDGRTHTFCGTPAYLAPEMLGGKAGYGLEVDLWALGALVYEMLTGRVPFRAHGEALYELILTDEPQYPPYLSRHAVSFIDGLLCKNPRKRLGFDTGVPTAADKRTASSLSLRQMDATGIKAHKFFASLEWHRADRFLVPPPYVPGFKDLADTHNFFAREDDIMTVLRPSLIAAERHVTDEALAMYDKYWDEF